MEEKTIVHRLLVWTPEANIPVESPGQMWEKDIKMVLTAEELETKDRLFSWDTDMCWAVVN